MIMLICVALLIYCLVVSHFLFLLGSMVLSSCIFYEWVRKIKRKYRKVLLGIWIILLPISIILTGIITFLYIWIGGCGGQGLR